MQVTSKGVKINDVVETGKEFQTSLKIDNKEVFGKIIELGSFPNNTSTECDSSISKDNTIVDFEVIASAANGVAIKVPYITTNGNFIRSSIWVSNDTYVVEILSNYNATNYLGQAIIYYTK